MNTPRKASKNLAMAMVAFLMLILASLACDIDQNYGPITVGDAPSSFVPAVSENHSWTASVIPNKKYALTIKVTQGSLNDNNSLWVNDEKGQITYGFVQGVITTQKNLNLVFTGPSDGKILILFIPGTGQATCTIELHQL